MKHLLVTLAVAAVIGPALRPGAAWAQEGAPGSGETTAADDSTGQAAQAATDDEARFDPAQPDYTVINLPTSARLRRFGSAFRVTHRFFRPLGAGDFGSLVDDFFGIDSGAAIGLEFRFAPVRGGQIGVHRTNGKIIEFFGQYSLIEQSKGAPVSIDARASIDGTNNFKDSYTPALGAVISRSFGEAVGVHLVPMWVNNANPLPAELSAEANDSFVLGLGARVRVLSTVYLLGEIVPRLAGYDPGTMAGSFGIEKRVGRHLFQLNFSNQRGTAMSQLAQGALTSDDWFLGFNISRKF